MKWTGHLTTVILGLFLLTAAISFSPADLQAAVLEKDANPFEMVFTEKGGILLEQEGQEKYFQIWDRESNTLEKLRIPKCDIEDFDVDGNKLVYISSRDIYATVILHDLDSGESRNISTSYSQKRGIEICGDYIAWEDYALGKADIILYDMKTSTSSRIESNYADNLQLCLTADYLAYIDNNFNYRDIYLYDLDSGEKTMVRSNQKYKSSLYMDGNKIVWAEIRDGSGSGTAVTGSYFDQLWGYATKNNAVYDIWLYDIENGSTMKLTDSSANQIQSCVWDHYVAWAETGDGNPDISLLDLNSGSKSQISNTDAYEVKPALGYGNIAWISMRGNLADLHVELLPEGNASSVQTQNAEIKIVFNGTRFFMDPEPYIKNDRTMVPMRRIFEMLGQEVIWDKEERSVTTTQGSRSAKLFIGQTTAYRNGEAIELDVAPEILADKGRTMVPLRFVAEAAGCEVNWDGITRTVIINNKI